MVLAIIVLSIETFFCILANAIPPGNPGFAWFVFAVMVACTVVAAIILPKNIREIKNGASRGKAIAGTAISGAALAFGSIFLISFLIALV